MSIMGWCRSKTASAAGSSIRSTRFTSSSAKICAEVLLTVHHNLLAKEPWEKIEKIFSKAEVFSQCRNWLQRDGQGSADDSLSTAHGGAQMARDQAGVAAIGSKQAAELYGLHILFENIEDNPDNMTRFFVIGREAARRTGDDKTAIMFTTAHKPGRWPRCWMCSRRTGSI